LTTGKDGTSFIYEFIEEESRLYLIRDFYQKGYYSKYINISPDNEKIIITGDSGDETYEYNLLYTVIDMKKNKVIEKKIEKDTNSEIKGCWINNELYFRSKIDPVYSRERKLYRTEISIIDFNEDKEIFTIIVYLKELLINIEFCNKTKKRLYLISGFLIF
jgi:aminopeptidase C